MYIEICIISAITQRLKFFPVCTRKGENMNLEYILNSCSLEQVKELTEEARRLSSFSGKNFPEVREAFEEVDKFLNKKKNNLNPSRLWKLVRDPNPGYPYLCASINGVEEQSTAAAWAIQMFLIGDINQKRAIFELNTIRSYLYDRGVVPAREGGK